MTVQLRDSDGTVRLSGDLLATGGATGDALTQQADGTYTPAAGSTQTVYVQTADPGAVGAGMVWIRPPGNPGESAILQVRDSADAAWSNRLQITADALDVFVGSAQVLAASASGFQAGSAAGAVLTVNSGQMKYEADNGDDIVIAHPSGQVELDPQNGQVDALGGSLGGFLRLAAGSEPDDARLFNGSWIFYRDGNDLKAKANIGGSFLHLTVGTFA